MKPLYCLLLLFLTLNTQAQSDDGSVLDKHNWTVRSYVFSQPYTYDRADPLPNFFTGIGLKRNFDKISLRLSYEYAPYSVELEGKSGYRTIHNTNSFKEHTVRLGAEYRKVYEGRISVNFILDLALSELTTVSYVTDSIYDPISFNRINGNAIGGICGIGIDYFLTPKLSIALESRFDVLYNYSRYSLINYENNTSVNYNLDNNRLNLKLLGNFSVNYHF